MLLDKEEVSKGLQFYQIEDEKYYNKCIKALEEIKQKNLLDNFEKIYDILFLNKKREIEDLWQYKEIENLFGANIIFITNVMLLLGYKKHIETINRLNFSQKQIEIQKKRVKECLIKDVYIKKLDSIRISQMLWGAYFISGKLIEVGRLQYELDNNNIYIHIPDGEKLNHEKVIDSLNKSKKYINKYFNISNYSYYCKSWLLSPQLKNMLNSTSNIIKFQTFFDITEGESCIEDILNFVFNTHKIEDYKLLEENTKLQKNIKQFLLNGNDIKLGLGKLKTKEV